MSPQAAATPTGTPEPEPTATSPTEGIVETRTPEPTATPTPEPTATPTPSVTPTPTPTVTPGNLVVTTTDDELSSDGDCSLREALEAANTDTVVDACGSGSGNDIITFDLPAGSTILLGGSHLTISTNVMIEGELFTLRPEKGHGSGNENFKVRF